MNSLEKLPLKRMGGKYFSINHGKLENLKQDLDSFLLGQEFMLSKDFARDVLFTHEVKFNNAVEEYNDDIDIIQKIISNPTKRNLTERERRILNLYKGYHYISDKEKDINKDTLKRLYQILSYKLLSKVDLERMGEFYRNDPVYIFFSSNISTPPDEGIDASELDIYMEQFFSFVNNEKDLSLTEEYIKSQIMHFYFVYIHPYYDINERTSRTTSIWYLLNKGAYPYIIFNRGISLQKNTYYKVIRRCKDEGNLTSFIEYMLNTVLVELEKEYLIHQIQNEKDITPLEHQSLQYILSLNGLKTFGDFSRFYNSHNEKKSQREIHQTMILPLLEKDIIKINRNSKKFLYEGLKNSIFELNLEDIDLDKEKVRLLQI